MIDRRRKNSARRVFDKCFRTHHSFRSGDSIRAFTQPVPQSVPGYREVTLGGVPRIIATTNSSYMRSPSIVNSRGRVRANTSRSDTC
jgi:hypothetical protein